MTRNEDEISNANTNDSLISCSKTSSETIISENEEGKVKCCRIERRGGKCASVCYLTVGTISILWAVTTLVWTPFDILMNERLRMRPGLPPYEWWKDPPDKVLFRTYIFNVTNSEEYLNNPSVKLNFEEIGPLVYLEKLVHSNITFNKNGTLTYVATRKAIFVPELNHLLLNQTIIVPNWASLGVASFLWDQSLFVKFGLNLLMRTIKPKPFVTLTIDQLLWNFTDPILDAAQKIAPFMIPSNNLGVLARIYNNFENTVTVYIGGEHGHEKFFLIDRYDGSEHLPNWGSTCSEKVTNATEGVTYPQYITPDDRIRYWRNTLCKNAVLDYQGNVTQHGVRAYRFVLPNTTFDRTIPKRDDCFKGDPVLRDGLSDISKCHHGFPLAVSFPHYLHGDPSLRDNVTGLSPDQAKHSSFVIVEPITGIPMESCARSQCNLVVKKLRGFNQLVSRFSNMVIPMFWLEYNQTGLPWYILTLVYFQVNLLPIFQRIFTAVLLIIGIACFVAFLKRRKRRKLLAANKAMVFIKEHELFIENKI